jgi:hypothetical protein
MIDWTTRPNHVVLKFHYGKRGSLNHIISKTMGRVAVINHAYQGAMPQAGSFWLCRIDKELGAEKPTGCFVVAPIKEVPVDKVMKLVPGIYDTDIQDKTVICTPKVDNCFWIIPFSLKKSYIKKDKADTLYQSVVVPVTLDEIK